MNSESHTAETGEVVIEPSFDQPAISFYQRFAAVILFMLVVSLPFFSVRNPMLRLSPPLWMMIIVGVVGALRCLYLRKISLDIFDFMLLGYLGIVLANCAFLPQADNQYLILAKSVVYFALFATLKQFLMDFPIAVMEKVIFRGVIVGSFGFVAIALFALWRTGNLSVLTSSWKYYTLTLQTFASIDIVFGQQRMEEFASRDVMRNAVGEVFTLYFLLAQVFRNKQISLWPPLLLVLNGLLIVLTFSRRAFFAVAAVAMIAFKPNQQGVKRFLFTLLVLASLFTLTLFMEGDSRLIDVSGGSRMDQYTEALSTWSEKPIFGVGYGTQLNGRYVHNFVFSSMFFMGIPGLIFSLGITGYLLFHFFKGSFLQDNNLANLLVIPLFGLAVGATAEGIFTITQWFAIATFQRIRLESAEQGLEIGEFDDGE